MHKVDCHPCIIYPGGDPDIIDRFDLIAVPGGPDIDPSIYGQEKHPKLDKLDALRDEFEQKVIKRAIEKEKPIFAVCRGMQMINAVLGGTLYQHLPDKFDQVEHRALVGPHAYSHTVKTSSWLKELLGEEIHINSWHHQGIHQLSADLRPLAWSEEGLIEAYESKQHLPPILAVQWHPEILQDENSIKLLEHFIETNLLRKGSGVKK